jgi:hypothetical protein
LTSITLPAGLVFIGNNVFYGCDKLTSVDIPGGVTFIGREAFSGCAGLTSAALPDGLSHIGDGAFQRCAGLASITIPESVATIETGAFIGCAGMKAAYIGANATGSDMFLGCASLSEVDLSDNTGNIGAGSFSYCDSLNMMTLPESVTGIGDNAFKGSGMKGVIFSDFGYMPFVSVSLNGRGLDFDVPALIVGGRTLVPMRKVFEELGARVVWDAGTQTVTAYLLDKVIAMQIGNHVMQADGRDLELDVPPQVLFSRTFAPVRAVSESLGAAVGWDEDSYTVTIAMD